MMNRKKLLPIAFFILLNQPYVSSQEIAYSNQQEKLHAGLDFSSMDHFFEVTSVLLKDEEPNRAQWDRLFKTHAYQLLANREPWFSGQYFESRFRLVFKPSQRDLLNKKLAELEKRSYSAELVRLRHYCQVRDTRDKLQSQVDRFKNSAIFEKAKKRAAEFLPDQGVQGNPRISFLIFAPDARGYSTLLMDPVYLNRVSDPVNLLAHELHHFYLNRLWKLDSDNIDAPDKTLIAILDQIYKEGIADQIDKPSAFYGDNIQASDEESAQKYRQWVMETPELIKKLDGLLLRIAEDPQEMWEQGPKFAGLVPKSGHPTGYYMAQMIYNSLGKDSLLEDSGNPFAFIKKFNRASELHYPDRVRFSKKSMGVFDYLEDKYVNNPLKPESCHPVPPCFGIDLSSMDRFIDIVHILKKDKEPTEAQWTALFSAHGYYMLIHSGESAFYSQEYYFKKYFRLVFKPSEKEGLSTEMRGLSKVKNRRDNGHYYRYKCVKHLCEVRDSLDSILAYMEKLRDSSIKERVSKILLGFLPQSALKNNPGICLLIFARDYRAYNRPVLMDALYGMGMNPIPEHLAARWGAYQILPKIMLLDPEKVGDEDKVLLDAMSNVYTQGVLDLVDVKSNYFCKAPLPEHAEDAKRYCKRFMDAPDVIKKLNAILERISEEPGNKEKLSQDFSRAIPGRGGSLGYYMALTITDELGAKALKNIAGNPIGFFLKFNEAEAKKKSGIPGFTEKAVAVVDRLQEEYL